MKGLVPVTKQEKVQHTKLRRAQAREILAANKENWQHTFQKNYSNIESVDGVTTEETTQEAMQTVCSVNAIQNHKW